MIPTGNAKFALVIAERHLGMSPSGDKGLKEYTKTNQTMGDPTPCWPKPIGRSNRLVCDREK
jgi:hypothetical protein